MIIDMHVHILGEGYLPDAWNWSVARRWAYERMPYRDPKDIFPRIMPGLSDPEATYLMSALDEAGIDAAVCITIDYGYGLGQEQATPIEEVMEHYGDLQKKYPGRFYAFASVDPRRDGVLELFKKSIKDWALKGLKMYPQTGYYINDEICQPFYKKCVEWGVPVMIHTALAGYPWKTRFIHPIYIADIQVDYPKLIIIFAHAGYFEWWGEATAIARSNVNSYLELSMWQRQALVDPGAFIEKLAKMRDAVGPHRLLFGSDYGSGPRFSGERSVLPKWVKFFKDLPETGKEYGYQFTQNEIDLLLGGNAQRILGL